MTSTHDMTELPDQVAHPARDEAPAGGAGGCASASGSGTCARLALDRRGLLRGAAVAGTAVVAAGGLTACGHILDPNENAAAGAPPSNAAATDMTAPPATGSAAAQPMSNGGKDASMPAQKPSTAAARPSGTLLGKAAQIPAGGGLVFASHQVVVTQPNAGSYKAFSSVCTHAGCQCNDVTSGMITCPCHGAAFSIKDGSALQGPTQTPLPSRAVTVANGEIWLQA